MLTVTPSLVTVGPPNDLLMITLRPVGPMVTATASASLSTPLSILARAASSNINCFGTVIFLKGLESRVEGQEPEQLAIN